MGVEQVQICALLRTLFCHKKGTMNARDQLHPFPFRLEEGQATQAVIAKSIRSGFSGVGAGHLVRVEGISLYRKMHFSHAP